jgi:hypothetical protein
MDALKLVVNLAFKFTCQFPGGKVEIIENKA